MKNKLTLAAIGLFLMAMTLSCQQDGQEGDWVALFNGKDLDGWNIKIAGYPMNENFGNTFRVEDGLLKVSYDEYENFDNRFGHLFFHQPFSHYKLRVEYRFTGEQVPGGAGWAYRNNGIMFHAQPAETMAIDQHFPISVEAQLLGGSGEGERPTGSVCTPGTSVEIDGLKIDAHCFGSAGPTIDGDRWVTMEIVVLGDSVVHHIVEGDTVLTYGKLRYEGAMLYDLPGWGDLDGKPLTSGYIALQAESHPTEFRKIEIMDLSEKFPSGEPVALVEQYYHKEYFVSGSDTLPYRIMWPGNFRPEKQYPVLLFLHGAGERGRDNSAQLTHGGAWLASGDVRREFPAVVIFPQCASDNWWAKMERDQSPDGILSFAFNPDGEPTVPMRLLTELMDEVNGQPWADKQRFYLGGLSMGGMGTFELLHRRPEMFAAAFPICGGGNPGATEGFAKNTPLWVFHGDSDPIVSPDLSTAMVDALRAHGAEPRYTLYEGVGHNAWDHAFLEKDLLPWLFSFSKP
jgi:predicted esterase